MATSALYLYRAKQKEKKRKEREAKKANTIKQSALLGKNAWTMYNNVQTQKVNELLNLRTPDNKKAYTIDPEYLNWKRIFNPKDWFPPAGGRVKLTDAGEAAVNKGVFEDLQGAETLWEDFPGKESTTNLYKEVKGNLLGVKDKLSDMQENIEDWQDMPWFPKVEGDLDTIKSIDTKKNFLRETTDTNVNMFPDEGALDSEIIKNEVSDNITGAIKTKLVEGLGVPTDTAEVTAKTFIDQGLEPAQAIAAVDNAIKKTGGVFKAGGTALDAYNLVKTLENPDSTATEDLFAVGRAAASTVSLLGPQGAAAGLGMHTTLTLLELLNEYT